MYSHSVEQLNSTRLKLTIAIEKSAISGAFKKVLNEIKSGAEIRGFRKGKAPEALIKKFYATEVAKKAYEEIVEASYQASIKNSEHQIVSYPMIEPIGKFNENDEFKYTATVDINPKVEISGYKELSLKLSQAEPNLDEQVQEALKRLARDNGSFSKDESGRAVEKNDYVTFDYSISVEGKELTDKSRKGVRLFLDGTNLSDLEAGVVGMKAGETKTFSVAFPEDYGDAELKGKKADFTAKVGAIEILNAPELNDEFAKRYNLESFEDMKRNVSNSLVGLNEKSKVTQLREQIISQVLEKNSFEVPESLIEGTIDRAIAEANSRQPKNAQANPEDETVREQYKEWAGKEVKGVLALGHIARLEGMTVEDKEVSAEMVTFAAQSGMRPQDLVKRYGAPIIEEFRGKVLIDKVLKHIISLNNVAAAD